MTIIRTYERNERTGNGHYEGRTRNRLENRDRQGTITSIDSEYTVVHRHVVLYQTTDDNQKGNETQSQTPCRSSAHRLIFGRLCRRWRRTLRGSHRASICCRSGRSSDRDGGSDGFRRIRRTRRRSPRRRAGRRRCRGGGRGDRAGRTEGGCEDPRGEQAGLFDVRGCSIAIFR
jgi:hypothetical protein